MLGMCRKNIPSVLGHVSVQLGEVESPLFVAHGHSLLIGARQFFGIPGVHNDAAVQTLGCSGEFRENQHSVALLLRGDVLVSYQVHAVAGRRNNTGIGDSVESDEFVKVDGLVQEVNRLELDGAFG